MKKISFPSVLCLGLLAGACVAQEHTRPATVADETPTPPTRREVRRSPRGVRAEPKVNKMTWEISGYGECVEDAEQAALKKAKTTVAAFLADRGLHTEPTLEEVRRRMVKKITPEKMTENDELVAINATDKVVLNVELSEGDYSTFLRQDRKIRSRIRMTDFGKVLGVLLIGLTFLGGYLRLEEACKGYYTTLLRLAATVVVVVVACASIFFVRAG